jgi:hypothetical protein
MALMIESIMYLGIGFLAASISVLAVVPIVHTRAVRLTTRQLADTMPSSVAEIATDKDLLRAEFAMSTRTLEMKVDQLKGKGANQLLELGRAATPSTISGSNSTRYASGCTPPMSSLPANPPRSRWRNTPSRIGRRSWPR